MLNVQLRIQSDGGESLLLERCVAKYELREAISELFELTAEILVTDHALEAADLVGRQVLVTLGDEGALTQVQGIVGRLRQLTAEPTGVSRYQIVVVPVVWPLTRRTDHRILRDLSVTDIAEGILLLHGMPDARILAAPRPKREYCVQYGETDFAFIQRILADEGLSFYFDHQQLDLVDGSRPVSQMTIEEIRPQASDYPIVLQYAPVHELRRDDFNVLRVLVSAGIDTNAVQLRGYDFERPLFDPGVDLTAKADKPIFQREGTLESYVYEGGALTRGDLADRPRQLLDEARAGRTTYEIETSFALAAGTRFGLEGHPHASVNVGMLVVRSTTVVRLEHDKPVARYILECVPAADGYRPPRRPKPLIHGTHTALVVGKELGRDEIEVDEYGRVRVWFHWDREMQRFEGKLSRFIRVSQAWAGAGYGMVLLPRVGDEVIVAYTDGDPDEPIIIGRVHNAVSTTPLNLKNPDDFTVSIWKSRSSPRMGDDVDRYNMVRMQDKAGAEMLELRAQRDFHHETLANASIQVGGSQSTSAGSISETSASTISVSAKESITEHAGVSINESSGGNIGHTAAMNMRLVAGNRLEAESVTVKVEAAMLASVHAGADLVLQSDVNASLGASVVEIDGGASVSIRGGEVSAQAAKSMHVSGEKVTVVGTGPVTIKGGGIVKIIGGVVEIVGGRIKLN